MRLVRVRECDGKCCEESPRFPNAEGTHCIYYNPAVAAEVGVQAFIGGCTIMRGEASVPAGESPINPGRAAAEIYQQTCVDWPENMLGRNTGGCCLQWVDDD